MAFRARAQTVGRQSSLSQVLDASRAVEHVDLAEKTASELCCREYGLAEKKIFPAFDLLFDCFWREMSYERCDGNQEIEGTPSESPAREGGDEEGGLEEPRQDLSQETCRWRISDEFRCRRL